MQGTGQVTADANAQRYLELLKRCLTREIFLDQEVVDYWWAGFDDLLGDSATSWAALRERGLRIVQPSRPAGVSVPDADWLPTAETMIGMPRLENIEALVKRALRDDVPGDLVEAGVWRGGAAILMRALLDALDDRIRHVWACDSFQGLPTPNLDLYPEDAEFERTTPLDEGVNAALAISVDTVKRNFRRYGLLDERVHFIEGWFKDTLATAPIEQIAVLRVDGDLYESTMDVLVNLEPRVSIGGFVIIDDYNALAPCQKAVTDYRNARGISSDLHEVDWTAVWWQKEPNESS